jgi:hypothetical protein
VGDDVVAGLERADAFQALDHIGRARPEHDLGQCVHPQPEAVPEHAADACGLGGGQHAPGDQQAALLHRLDLDQVGRVGADDRDQAGMVDDRFVGHDRQERALAAHPRHAGDVVGRHRLLEEFQPQRVDAPCQRNRRVGVIAGIRVDAQPEGRPHRSTDGGQSFDIGVDVMADLDLCRGEAACLPGERLSGGLRRRQDADPRIEGERVAHRTAQQRGDRHALGACRCVAASHLDGGLGVEVPRADSRHRIEHAMQVARVQTQHAGTNRSASADRVSSVDSSE